MCQVIEGCAIKHDPVVVIDCHLGAIEAHKSTAYPVNGVEQLPDQGLLHALAQKIILEILEQALAVKPVVSGSKAATGYGGDSIDFIEHTRAGASAIDQCIPQLLHDTVGQGRCP